MDSKMNVQDDISRLAKPKRKGILALIFSRFFIIVLLILVELLVVLIPVILLSESFSHFITGIAGFTIVF